MGGVIQRTAKAKKTFGNKRQGLIEIQSNNTSLQSNQYVLSKGNQFIVSNSAKKVPLTPTAEQNTKPKDSNRTGRKINFPPKPVKMSQN